MIVRARAGRFAIAAAVVATVLVGLAMWRASGPAPARNVVIITLDTTRADRLSPYGFMNVSLPHIERLAREGVVFDQAQTVAPLTLTAHSSLFTGLFPPRHGVRDNADRALAPGHTTLAEWLQARAFRTAAFVGSIVLDKDRGLAQGFDEYRGVTPSSDPGPGGRQRRADEVVGEAIRWLDSDRADSPFLLWAHLFDPHRPYNPPEPYSTRYAHNLYVGEIAFADEQIGVLLDVLERTNRLDDTVVVLVGDHGESLGAHGERDHGIFVYEDVLRVPLIVRAPGIAPGRVGDLVRLTDLVPTLLELLQQPAMATDGISLAGVMRGGPAPQVTAYAESFYPGRLGWSPLRAVRDRRYKFIDAPRPELYDLQDDPAEEHNLYETRRALAATLAQQLDMIGRAGPTDARAADGQPISRDLASQLAALGYLGSAAPRRDGAGQLPDPKDCMRGPSAPAIVPPECGPRRPMEEMLFYTRAR
jgi:choline-sulfatase